MVVAMGCWGGRAEWELGSTVEVVVEGKKEWVDDLLTLNRD